MQSRWNVFVVAAAALLLAISGLGCPSSSNCKVDNPCDNEGEVRCADASTVETCTRNADNCLGWVATACATGMVCEEGAEETGCVVDCDHECDPAVHPACSADGLAIETCELQNDGCFDLVTTGCDVDLVCDDSGEEVVCTCVDDCDPEMYPACSEDSSAVETCVEGLDGCFDMVVTDCGMGELCEDDGAAPECVVQCTDDCDVADYPACSASGFAIETCEEQADGCNDIVATDCGAGEACDAGTITCQVTGCTDDCDPANYPVCGGDGVSIDTCERQADGCYDMGNTACGAEEVCDASGGDPICTCVNDCDPANYPACSASGFAVETCVEGGDGCYDMVVTDCGAGEACDDNTITCETTGCSDDCVPANYPVCGVDGVSIDACERQADGCYDTINTACGADLVCDAAGGAPACVCSNDCDPANYPACSGDTLSVETCEVQADGCYDMISTACLNNEVCDPDTFTCVVPCVNDCALADYPVCSGDNLAIETCEVQADGCNDLISTACGADLLCDASGGTPECVCSNDCDPAAYPVCSGDNLAIETCEQQGDGCYDLISTDCGGDLVCDASGGAPACVCSNECDPGAYPACLNDLTGTETCEVQADGCYDLATVTCGFNEACDAGGSNLCELDANCMHAVVGGGIEGGTPNADWDEYSYNFGSPICSVGSCGDAGGTAYAHGGDYFVWLGGSGDAEEGWVRQTVRIPLTATATLRFYLYIPHTTAAAADVFEVRMDADVLFSVDGTGTAAYANDYVLIELDVAAYNDGLGHTLEFYSDTAGAVGEDVTNFLVDDISLIACDGTCVHECDVVDALQCSPDLAEIWICQAQAGDCNIWGVDTPCAMGEQCDALADPPVCYAPMPGDPGDNCSDPRMMPLEVPADLPFASLGQTNCGRGNDYSDTCLDYYDSGEDIIYQVNVTEPTAFNITLDPKATTYSGFAIGDSCPLGAACAYGSTSSSAAVHETGCQAYQPGLYAIQVDTWAAPDCIPDFDLSIASCACGEGQTTCLDGTTLGTCDAAGTYASTACAETCAELAPGQFGCAIAPVAAGELVITEIIQDPSAVNDNNGEWFELYNPGAENLNLNGVVFQDDGGDSFTVDVDLAVPAMGYAVLGRSTDPAVNGGLVVNYAYGAQMNLANGADEIEIVAGGTSIDRVAYDGGPDFPDPTGASMSLNALFTDAADNDTGANWCDAVTAYGDGDLGTPGADNPTCPFATTHLSADLETDPGWTVSGDWEFGVPDAAYAGGPTGCANDSAGCYGTNMAGDYSASQDYDTCNVAFGPVDLSGAANAYLNFAMWLNTENNYDGARVEVSTDGNVWEVLPMMTPAYNWNDPADAWSGSTGGEWWTAVADLTSWVGGDLYVRFGLSSDGSVYYAGFYVDDVVVGSY